MPSDSPIPGTPLPVTADVDLGLPSTHGNFRPSMSRGVPTSFSTPGSNLISSLRANTQGVAQASRRQLGGMTRTRFASSTFQTVQPPAPASMPTSATAGGSIPPGTYSSTGPIIDGQQLKLHSSPVTLFYKQQTVKMFDKSQRATMKADELAAFIERSTRRIVHPKKLLKMPTYTTDGAQMLHDLVETKLTLDLMVDHMAVHDIMDGLTIVLPADVQTSSAVSPKTYNLFEDYPLLTTDIVQVSTMRVLSNVGC